MILPSARATLTATLLLAAVAPAGRAFAQTPGARTPGDPINEGSAGRARKTAGPEYDQVSGLRRFLFGSNWRTVWATPIEVDVLDLSKYAGGVTPFKSGGNQTRTLHLKGGDGRHYVFRSVSKSVQQSLGPDLEHTTIGNVIQDQTSADLPSSATVADVIQRAAGVVHPSPHLYLMPDDARLGEYRKEFAGLLGHMEVKPDDDIPDGVEPFANADKVQDADKLLESLEASTEYRLDTRAYLKARLVDAIMGDFDRGADQWDFARIDSGGIKTFVPIARDRDWAFMHANGSLMRLVRGIYAKIGSYDAENEKLRSITFMTHEFDRSHLVALPWSTWDSVATEIRTALTDAVITEAVNAQPASYVAVDGARIREGLTARRNGLPDLAREFFDLVNKEADVFAADENERADIVQHADGSMTVTIHRLKDDGSVSTKEGAAFERTFLPADTREVRVYMQEGDDVVNITGSGASRIKLRIVGGDGNDVLMDSTTATAGEQVEFYDATGTNRIVKGPRTTMHTTPFVTAQPTTLDPEPKQKPRTRAVQEERRGHFQDQWRIEGADFATQRTQSISTRFWGATNKLSPVLGLRDGSGIVIGPGITHTDYGFRSEPFASRTSVHAMYATRANRFGADISSEWHPRNASYAISALVRGTGFESQRFYGYGNNTANIPEDGPVILRDELHVESSLHWGSDSDTQFTVGPVFNLVSPRVPLGSPADLADALGTESFGAVGGQALFRHSHVDHRYTPHSGYRASIAITGFEGIQNSDGAFGKASGTLSVYIPVFRPTLALRVGGQRAVGNFPIHEAAMIGGRDNLRGFAWERFAGDAAAFGNAELRVPLTRAELLVRGDVGLIVLADAGRVWMDGVSSGPWHHSFGGGLSFSALSKAASIVFAHGEDSRVYLNLGLPF